MSCYHLISSLFFSFFFRLAPQGSITLTASPGYEKVLNRPTTAAFPSRRTIRYLPGSLLKLTVTLRGHKCQVWPGDWACVVEQLFDEQLVQENHKENINLCSTGPCEVNVTGDRLNPLIKATRLRWGVCVWGGGGGGGGGGIFGRQYNWYSYLYFSKYRIAVAKLF